MVPDRLKRFLTGPTQAEVLQALPDFKRAMLELPNGVFTAGGGIVLGEGGNHSYTDLFGRQRFDLMIVVNQKPTRELLQVLGLPAKFRGIPVKYIQQGTIRSA